MLELSIVMAACNDNYGGEVYRDGYEPAVPTPQKDRMRLSFYTLHEAFKNIDYEVVFVEWNPPEDKEKISDWEFMQHPRVRVIEVPSYICQREMPEHSFHEFHAKNIGIRRAKGEMILCSNPDILWLNPFSHFNFSNGVMISLRHTVFHNVLECGLDLDCVRRYCFTTGNWIDADWGSNGDFTLMHRDTWFELEGYSVVPNKIAGGDQLQVRRGERLTGNLYKYHFAIHHIRHAGRPLLSLGPEEIITSKDFGLPNENLKERRG